MVTLARAVTPEWIRAMRRVDLTLDMVQSLAISIRATAAILDSWIRATAVIRVMVIRETAVIRATALLVMVRIREQLREDLTTRLIVRPMVKCRTIRFKRATVFGKSRATLCVSPGSPRVRERS